MATHTTQQQWRRAPAVSDLCEAGGKRLLQRALAAREDSALVLPALRTNATAVVAASPMSHI